MDDKVNISKVSDEFVLDMNYGISNNIDNSIENYSYDDDEEEYTLLAKREGNPWAERFPRQ